MRCCMCGFLVVILTVLLNEATLIDAGKAADISPYCLLECGCFLDKRTDTPPHHFLVHQHTMCVHDDQPDEVACGAGANSRHFSTREIDDILGWHNLVRSRTAQGRMIGRDAARYHYSIAQASVVTDPVRHVPLPAASNMRALVWDEELAAIAGRAAIQCNVQLKECRNTATNSDVGQIIVEQAVDGNDLDDAGDTATSMIAGLLTASSRLTPVMIRDGGGITDDMAETIDAQLLWANVTAVGCGRIVYFDGTTDAPRGGGGAKLLVVCNYDAGARREGPVYVQGEACSACDSGFKCSGDETTSGLCVRPLSGAPSARFSVFPLLINLAVVVRLAI